MANLTFIERAGNPDEPGGSGHSMEIQQASAIYLLDQGSGVDGAVTGQDILSAIKQLVGSCSNATQAGRLNRTQPTPHPLYWWLYAHNISRQWGYGLGTLTAAASNSLYPEPPIQQFGLYDQYYFQVEYASLPYAPASNAFVPISSGTSTWYNTAGTAIGYTYAPEWYRWCDVQKLPLPSSDTNLTQIGGNIGAGTFKAGAGSAVNGVTFNGAFQLQLPNSIYKLTWYEVPIRYMLSANSYFDSWRNRVNYATINLGKVVANPGELLLLDWQPRVYTPPNPELVTYFSGISQPSELINIEFTFLFTRRNCPSLPASTTKPNSVMGGHNLLPSFIDRQFYYWETNVDGSLGGWPAYLSAPLECLFNDPDNSTIGIPLASRN